MTLKLLKQMENLDIHNILIALCVYVASVILVGIIEFVLHYNYKEECKISWLHILTPWLNTMYLIVLCLCIPAAIINAFFPGNRDEG